MRCVLSTVAVQVRAAKALTHRSPDTGTWPLLRLPGVRPPDVDVAVAVARGRRLCTTTLRAFDRSLLAACLAERCLDQHALAPAKPASDVDELPAAPLDRFGAEDGKACEAASVMLVHVRRGN